MLWTLLGVFVGGMALNLTPCVYPLIPITVSYFGGSKQGGRQELALHGLLYIGGLALTNSLLGVVAALTGSLMGSALQNPIVLIIIAATLVVFASSLFGFWELQLPQSLTSAASKTYSGYFGTFFMGLTLGVIAAPCLGPFVLGLLTWVASLGSPWLGFIIFFTLSLGLGVPLFILAMFSGSLDKLPGSGEWMLWVRKLMGWVLVGMTVYFIRPLLAPATGKIITAVIAIVAGIHLGWVDRTQGGFRGFGIIKSLVGASGLALGVFLIGSWLMMGSGVVWHSYSEQVFEQARKVNKPMIVDFSAAWCAPCRELDEITFHDPAVIKMAEDQFIMIKVDLTTQGSQLNQDLVTRYSIKGVPTVLFLDPHGNEKTDLRLIGFIPPDQFMNRMSEAKRRSLSNTTKN